MKKILILAAGLWLGCASTTSAQLWKDSFSQPAGSALAGQASDSGTVWESIGPAGPGISLQAGSLVVPNLSAPAGNRARLASVNGPGVRAGLGVSVNSNTLYYSLSLRVTDLGALGTNGGTLAGFNNATGAAPTLPAVMAARLLVRTAPGGYQVGLAKNSTNTADFFWASATVATGDVVFVVASYDFLPGVDDVAKLWLNTSAAEFGATNAPPPSLTTSIGPDINRIDSFALSQQPAPFLPAITFVDEVRVGNDWASVTPPGMDFGDAPEDTFPYSTTRARNGARHGGSPGSLRFGTAKDLETDGLPSLAADQDDLSGGPDDEDGVTFGGSWLPGGTAWADVVVSTAGRVDAWVDWNRTAGWEPSEKVVNNLPVTPGAPVRFTFIVPPGTTTGPTYARFRLSTAGGLTPVGFASDGEVEDYRVEVTTSSVITFNGLPREALGTAQLSVTSNLLSLMATGSSSGVKVMLGEGEGWAGAFKGLTNAAAGNSVLEFSAYGNTNGPATNRLLSTVRLDGQGSNVAVSVDFSGLGATRFKAVFHDAQGRIIASRTITPPSPGTPPVRLFECPDGTVVVQAAVFVFGRWLFIVDCANGVTLGPDLSETTIPEFNIMELIPIVDASEYIDYIVRELRILIPAGPGPVFLNDGVYKNGGLYTASEDLSLQVTTGGIATDSSGSTALRGLQLRSGVSDLSAGVLPDSFDVDVLHGGRVGLNWPAPPQFNNAAVLRSQLSARAADGSSLREWQAELLGFTNNPDNLCLVFTESGISNAALALLEVYQSSNLVGSMTVPAGELGMLTGSGVVTELATPATDPSGFAFTFNSPMSFVRSNSPPLVGTVFVCRSTTGDTIKDHLRRLTVETTGALMFGIGASLGLDRGDAPAAASLLDARHFTGTELRLGANWDREARGAASTNALGDDLAGTDDEDGVAVVGSVFQGETMTMQVTTTGTVAGWLSIWADWNDDGDFDDGGEFVYHYCGPDCYADDVYSTISVGGHGTHSIEIPVPRGVVTSGGYAYRNVRVRISDQVLAEGDHSRYSYAGEVEDHQVQVLVRPELDTGGVRYIALGLAGMEEGTNGVQVLNLGSSGEDGVRLKFGGSRGNASASFSSAALEQTNSNLEIKWTASLQAGRESSIGSFRLERQGPGALFLGDFSLFGSNVIQIELWNNGALSGATTATGSNFAGSVQGWNAAPLPAVSQATLLTDRAEGGLVFTLRFAGVVEFTLPGLAGVAGEELRVTVPAGRLRVDGVASLEVRAANVAGFGMPGATMISSRPVLQLARRAGQRQLHWAESDALLQEAPVLTGPWTTASNAAPGVVVTNPNPQQFFRLMQTAARSELATMLRQAELVFEGTVLSVEYRDSNAQGTNLPPVPHTFVTFAVNQVFKGSTTNGGTLTLRLAGGLSADARLLRIKASTLFDVGERSILLVRGNGRLASPIVRWSGGRFRLNNGFAYTEGGRELVSTEAGRLEVGPWRDLTEVRENDIAGQMLEIIRSPDVSEEGQPIPPPAGQPMTEAAFRQFIAGLIARVHTPEELQDLVPVASASSAQPFSVRNPVPRRVQ